MDVRSLGRSVRGVLALALLAAGCGGGTGGGGGERTPQFVLKPVGSSSAAGTMLVGIDRRSIDANQSDQVRITAQVIDPTGRPLAGIGVTFHASIADVTFVDGVPVKVNDNLPAAEAITDGAGIAVVTVQSGATPGRLAIQAFTSNLNLDLGGVVFLQIADVGFVSGDLQVLPDQIDVSDPKPGTTLEFLVTGGEPFTPPSAPYRLQDATSAIGTAVLVDQGTYPVSIRYTISGKAAGTHVFNVVDAKGSLASGSVVVAVSTMAFQPTSASVTAGGKQVFAIGGGVAPYQCRSSAGSIYPATVERGGTLTFDSSGIGIPTTVTIVCTDVSGQSASATVTVAVPTIFVQPSSASLSGGQSQTFVLGGGAPPYRCEATGGTIVPSEVANAGGSVTFTATPTATTSTGSLSCVDSAGQAVTASITINSLTPRIDPAQATIGSGASQVFAVSSGTAPYECSATGGKVSPATVYESGGTFVFTADQTAVNTQASVLCRDATGQVATASINVTTTAPKIEPAQATVVAGSSQVFAVSSGTAPYRCSATGGTIAPDLVATPGGTLTFTANQTAVGVQGSIVCTDATGQVATATISVTTTGPKIEPSQVTLAAGASQVFAVSGGTAPYVCTATGGTIAPDTVTISGGTLLFTASQTASQATVVCRDASGQVTTASVVIGASNLVVAPAQATLPGGGSQVFAVSGGLPPYQCQTTLGTLSNATIAASGGTTTFTADLVSANTSASLVCTDASGHVASATISVTTTPPRIEPGAVTMIGGQSQVFAVTDGDPPYDCVSSAGVLNPRTINERGGTTVFTAAPVAQPATATIIGTDATGQVATATVTINPQPTPTPEPSGTPSPSSSPPLPTPTPVRIRTIVLRANPSSLDGVAGGTSTIVATVLDDFNQVVPGVTVLFTLPGQTGDPTASIPTVDPLTETTDGAGRAVTTLTVPPGTPPQFLSVTATARDVSGTGQVAIVAHNVNPPGPPVHVTAALYSDRSGRNGDGTLVTVLSALVTDANGNPVVDGLDVTWSLLSPLSANVTSPTATNKLPPCDVAPYVEATGIALTPQPGTALTCLIFPADLVGQTATIRISVPGTTLVETSTLSFPAPPPPP